MDKYKKNKLKLKLFEQEGVKALLLDLIKVMAEEGFVTEDLKGQEEDFILILKAKYKREIAEVEEKQNKQQKLFK